VQCCLWHGKRDFPFLLYADGLKKASQQPFRNAVESAFSRIANRIKRMGKRWSDRGLLERLMLALAKSISSRALGSALETVHENQSKNDSV
jgi:hypothetical protein